MKKKIEESNNVNLMLKSRFLSDISDIRPRAQAEWILNNPSTTYQKMIDASWALRPKHMSDHVRAIKYLAKIGLILLNPDGTILLNKDFFPNNQKMPPKSFLKDI